MKAERTLVDLIVKQGWRPFTPFATVVSPRGFQLKVILPDGRTITGCLDEGQPLTPIRVVALGD